MLSAHHRPIHKDEGQKTKPLTCYFVVGATRFELVTSSVSGKRSPPELSARRYLLHAEPRSALAILRELPAKRKLEPR